MKSSLTDETIGNRNRSETLSKRMRSKREVWGVAPIYSYER
jgi:hypothetical protein